MESVRIIEEAEFSQIHAFPYSPREGTNAYKKYKELPSEVKKERVERILQQGEKQKQVYLEKYISKVLEIVPEHCIDGKMHTDIPDEFDVIEVPEPVRVIDHERFVGSELDKTAHLLLKAFAVVVNSLHGHHGTQILSA